MQDGSLYRFLIDPSDVQSIATLFIAKRDKFIGDGIEQIEFNGQFKPDDGEALYVDMEIPACFAPIPDNVHEINLIDLSQKLKIKTIVLYHDGDYYFQCFANRFICKRNAIAMVCSRNTFVSLKNPHAFTIEDAIDGFYHDGRFYFKSFAKAKQIFDLKDFYKEVTDQELQGIFEGDKFAGTDIEWLKKHADSIMRKQITMLKKSGLLDSIDISKRDFKTWARKAQIPKSVYENGHIVLPHNKKECKAVLAFLCEDVFEGYFSKQIYQSNSKRVK